MKCKLSNLYCFVGYLALRTVISFGEVMKSGEEFWEVEMLNTYLWASITRPFCNYGLGLVLLKWGLLRS